MNMSKKSNSNLTIGIDEAGRGPALGPLVMAAVALDTKTAAGLTRAGVTDSKSFGAGAKAHQKRVELAAIIRQKAQWYTVETIDAATVDARVFRNELNALEREVAAKMIRSAPVCKRIIADGERMFSPMREMFPHMLCKDGAESLHASVAAASMLAKTARDQWVQDFAEAHLSDFGPLTGGGYVNDGTRAFLRSYATKYGKVPADLRMSWPHPYLEDLLDIPALHAAALIAAGIETRHVDAKPKRVGGKKPAKFANPDQLLLL
jgi:ribonuclease HII